jgi:hypothetical protein
MKCFFAIFGEVSFDVMTPPPLPPSSIICFDKFLPVELLCFKPFTSTRTLQELLQFFSGFLSKIILDLFSILTSPMRVVIFLTPPPFL